MAFGLYLDASLTQPFGGTVTFPADAGGGTGPVDRVLYLGAPSGTLPLKAASNPGVDNIVITPADLNAGDGDPLSALKLAATQGGLASATPGAALSLGPAIQPGVANAVQVWFRFTAANLTVGQRSVFSFSTNSVQEV